MDASAEENRELIADFVDEALSSMTDLAVRLETHRANPADADAINAVFRSVHSIKGCAGFLNLLAIKTFSHALENTLDEIRQQRLELTSDLLRALVLGFDLLSEMLNAALAGEVAEELGDREHELLERVATLSAGAIVPHPTSEESLLASILALADEMSGAPELSLWVERLRKAAVAARLQGVETPSEAAPASSARPAANQTADEPSTNAEAARPTAAEAGGAQSRGRLVRVKEERLDEFLDHVSGLFITGEMLKDLHSRMRESRQMTSLVEEMRQINRAFASQTTNLQQRLVSLRRVSVAGLFAKFPRMARGLADQLGKQIDVHVSGEEVEIDKNLVEELDSPLTHMIRNVVDHGIEGPADRVKRGVGEVGNLWLHAEQTRTHVRLTVRDDGRGVDPERMRRKAVEKGMLTEVQARALSDQEATELIFAAGFSTAEKLSDISGRGVGMDVVRTTVREHNGDVHVESKVNVGTTFTITIPIRSGVLVVDGLLTETSGEKFVLPFEHLLEITFLKRSELTDVQGSLAARIRGNTYGAVHLSDVLELPKAEMQPNDILSVVLVGCKFGKLCLIVDRVLGHRQVVVNNVQDVLPCSSRLAGVAQLGGGRLALLLSVPEIVRQLHLHTR
ncbi:MAG: ATP-binding protein [Planctomycetia bacterium]|nr:ATP-binding protein [Planctomycetia bacterium]